jgi:hypothetical protein
MAFAGDASFRSINTSGITLVNSGLIKGLGQPVNGTDAANKQYVDAVAQGLDIKNSCFIASTENLLATYNVEDQSLVSTINGQLSLDSISITNTNIRVLIKNQITSKDNGLYMVVDIGSSDRPWILKRTLDANSPTNFTPGLFVFVESGLIHSGHGFVFIESGFEFVFETDPIMFTQFNAGKAYDAGHGLEISGSTISAVGTANRISVGPSGVDISSEYVGQSSITTVGTLTSGAINGFSGINNTPIGINGPSSGDFTSLITNSLRFVPEVIVSDSALSNFSKLFIVAAPTSGTVITLTIPPGADPNTMLWFVNTSMAANAQFRIDFGATNIVGLSGSSEGIVTFRYATMGACMSTQVIYNGSKWIFLNTGVDLS